MWFSGLDPLIRVVLVGAASYLVLLLILRVSGARSLAKLNAFDFTVTVALGSILATAVTSKDLSWASAATAMAVLLGLQFIVAKLLRAWPSLRGAATAQPVVIVRHGRLLEDGMSKARVGVGEVRQAARSGGFGDLSDIGAMVMETDGTLSVIGTDSLGDEGMLADLDRWESTR